MVERFEFTCPDCDPDKVSVNHGRYVRHSDYAALEAQLAERVKAEHEIVAKHVYEAMSWAAVLGPDAETGSVPRWVDGGNSLGQDEARKTADAILSALQPVADTVDFAEADHEEALGNFTAPDNATSSDVLAYVLFCASRWEPDARIIGNARAGDIARALLDMTNVLPSKKTRWRTFEAATHGWWGIELEQSEDEDEPILYPIKARRDSIESIVNAHNSAIEATQPAPKVTEAQAEVVAKLITKWLGRSWEGLPEGRVIEKGFPVFSHSQRGWGFNGRKGDMIDLAHEALTAAQEAGKP